MDGDGQLDIVVAGRVGSGDGVYIFSANGTLKRTMQASGSVYYGTALALADLDGDGIPEIIMQTNSAVNAWKGDGSIFPGWPVQVGGMRRRRRWGCPAKVMPNMSQISRSYQFAAGQRSTTLGNVGYSPHRGTLTRISALRS